jgi:hypothetical protein
LRGAERRSNPHPFVIIPSAKSISATIPHALPPSLSIQKPLSFFSAASVLKVSRNLMLLNKFLSINHNFVNHQ